MLQEPCFRGEPGALEVFCRLAGEKFGMAAGKPGARNLALYDTFDWRLYRNHLFCWQEEGELVLSASLYRPPVGQCPAPPGFRFWRDLPPGVARELLDEMAGPRALRVLAGVKGVEERCLVECGDNRPALRVHVFTLAPGSPAAGSYLVIGDREESRPHVMALKKLAQDCGLEDPGRSMLEDIIRRHGARPGSYSSRPALQLENRMPIHEALIIIYRSLLEIIRANINGIMDDVDTEFLHDFRVATRRTRSCLSEFRGFLPSPQEEGFRKAFRQLGRRSNTLRDLDVYLMNREKYQAMVPPGLHPGLHRYFTHLEQRREAEHLEFCRHLGTPDFGRMLEDWEALLENAAPGTQGGTAGVAAGERISARFNSIVQKGSRVSDDSPGEELHRIRIEGKKLRYLLELFRSCYPEPRVSILVGHLKALQNHLGEYNDLSVQLADLAGQLKREDVSRLEAASIGGLMALMHRRQSEVRAGFQHCFSEFSSPGNRLLYCTLPMAGTLE